VEIVDIQPFPNLRSVLDTFILEASFTRRKLLFHPAAVLTIATTMDFFAWSSQMDMIACLEHLLLIRAHVWNTWNISSHAPAAVMRRPLEENDTSLSSRVPVQIPDDERIYYSTGPTADGIAQFCGTILDVFF
jgi:hypothetical protein